MKLKQFRSFMRRLFNWNWLCTGINQASECSNPRNGMSAKNAKIFILSNVYNVLLWISSTLDIRNFRIRRVVPSLNVTNMSAYIRKIISGNKHFAQGENHRIGAEGIFTTFNYVGPSQTQKRGANAMIIISKTCYLRIAQGSQKTSLKLTCQLTKVTNWDSN